MPNLFLLKKIVAAAVLPPLMPILLLALALIVSSRQPRVGKRLAWFALLLLVFFSTPATVDLIAAPLERFAPPSPAQVEETQAIVILAGGKRGFAPEFGGSAPNRLTLERLRYGALVARRSGLPILVSGGAPTGQKPEAELMADALRDDFHLPAKWVDADSLDTQGNAQNSVRILEAAGIHRITLVTHAAHMRRAAREFELAGMEVLPAPTGFLTGGQFGSEIFRYLPNINSTYAGWYAAHEWIGLLAQRFRAQPAHTPPAEEAPVIPAKELANNMTNG